MGHNTEELSDADLKRLQNKLLEMMVEFDRFCEKEGIRYMLAAGTLLGAVRHRGFIPWDDDIDMMMLPEDYEKFLAARDRLPPHFFYGKAAYEGIDKVFDDRCPLTTEDPKDPSKHAFLDVFPLRPVSRVEGALNTLYGGVCNRHFYPKWHPKYWFYSLFRSWIRKGRLWAREHLAGRDDAFTYVNVGCARMTFARKDLEPVRSEEYSFEGHALMVPKGARACREGEFGSDYMTPHPPERRHYHIKAIYFLIRVQASLSCRMRQ